MKQIYADIGEQRKMWSKFYVLKTKFDIGIVSEYNCFFVYLWDLNNIDKRALFKVRVNTRKNQHFGEALIYQKNEKLYPVWYEEAINILKAV